NLASLGIALGQQNILAIQDLVTVPITVDGNGHNNTLQGPDQTNTWLINGPGSGTLDGSVTIEGMRSLQGGAGADTFRIAASSGASGNGSLAGLIDGGAGTNTLDYSGYKGAVLVDLPLGTATGVAGGVRHIHNVVGSAQGNDILVGDGT